MSFEIEIDRGPNGRSFEVRTEVDLARNEYYNTPYHLDVTVTMPDVKQQVTVNIYPSNS